VRGSGIVKNILLYSGVMKIFHKFSIKNCVAILRYHSICNPEESFYAFPSICIRPDVFEDQINYLSKNFNIISLDVFIETLKNKQDLPHKALILTFDDGYEDNYYAYKILNKYNVTGTFYIAAECVDNFSTLWLFEVFFLINNTSADSLKINFKNTSVEFQLKSPDNKKKCIRKIVEIIKSNDLATREIIREQLHHLLKDVNNFQAMSKKVMLTWEQVREMKNNGMTIGGHTMTHINLPNAKAEDARQEIIDCKELIENKIGSKVNHFSYPNGGNYDYYNDSIKQMVIDAGFLTSTTSNNGMADLLSDPFELNRIRVTSNLAEIIYQIKVEPFMDRLQGKFNS
jgi:peptidoglycan/xylan/chitin deacetylase (PgdA/CDA1 family)